MKIKNVKEMADIHDQVKNIFIKSSKPTAPIDETDNEQEGQGLKMLTPRRIIIKLLILLAQLNAGNNSEKL